MKHTALSKVKFVIKNQTRTRIQVSRYSGLCSFHPTASDCNICPARKFINVINHINISKMKKYMIEKCLQGRHQLTKSTPFCGFKSTSIWYQDQSNLIFSMRTQKNTHKRDIKMLNRKYTCYLKPTASYQSYDETPEEFSLKTEHDYLLTSFWSHIYNQFENIIKFSLTITRRNFNFLGVNLMQGIHKPYVKKPLTEGTE